MSALPWSGRQTWLAMPWLHPLRYLRQRLARWWQSRLPQTDTTTLTQRNVYILPTRAGLMLGVTLLVLLLASINYQLNLGYLLTFLLAGCALVAMHVSHATLRGLTLRLIAPDAVFMGATALFDIQVHNPGKWPRHAIELQVQGSSGTAHTDVAAQASAKVQLGWQPPARGQHPLPMLVAQTLFPLGSFRVWTLWRPAAQVLVYPQPEAPAPPLPPSAAHGTRESPAPSRIAQGEPDGLRAYRRGDALKMILWKKAAKSGELVSRDSVLLQGRELLLTRALTQLTQPEAQLSRLCAWLLQAEQRGLRYGLQLGQSDIAPDAGPAHLQRCLRLLALA